MNVKAVLFTIVWLLIVASTVCHAEVEVDLGHEHLWETYSEETHGGTPLWIELSDQTNMWHAYMQRFPVKVCTTCGEIQFGGSAPHAMHSYAVQEYILQHDNRHIQITWKCQVCQYLYTEQCELQLIKDGSMQSCLLGGNCDSSARAFLHDSGVILPEMTGNLPPVFREGERILLFALVYDEREHAFFTAYRVYCSLCGRPRMGLFSQPMVNFQEKWNGLPIMTEEYFLTVDMPENLPYQLIDQLRKEAGSA